MTESDLRAVLLMRAFEQAGTRDGLAADMGWAGAEARRQVGEAAAPEAWLVQRARLGLGRLAERDTSLQPWLAGVAGTGGSTGRVLATAVLAAAALLGLASDGLGASQQINLLALPLLGVLAWNLGVYALLLDLWLRRARPAGSQQSGLGPLRRLLLALASRLADWLGDRLSPGLATRSAGPMVYARFSHDWLATSQTLQAARLAALLHAAAACLVLGLLVSLYARGLALDYRAGWDSTFLDATSVHQVLGWLLGPAAALSGQVLPGPPALAGLRLATGGGESAARWIHLWALTLGLAVLLPRLLLAAWAWARAHALAADLRLPVDADDLRRLLQTASGQPLPVLVLPYSYQLDAQRQAALIGVLDAQLGASVQAQVQPSLPQGAEDDLPRWLPDASAATVVALFALTATPERESHGAFVLALATHLAGRASLQVWVDESGFVQRFGGAAGAQRLAQRRNAWTTLLGGQGVAPRFIDLSDPTS